MQTTFADFEVHPPHDHGLRVTLTDAEHAGEHHRIRPGGRVVLTGFTVTTGPGVDLLLTVRGSAAAGVGEVPVRIGVNGTEVALLRAQTSPDGSTETRVSIPASLLTLGAADGRTSGREDELTLDVAPDAGGDFLLRHLLLDPAFRPGQSERARREVADGGSLYAYLTHRGDESAPGSLWVRLGGLGRAGLASLSWRMADGDSASITFDSSQRRFSGRRIGADATAETPYEGQVVGIARMPRMLPREVRTVVFDAQLYQADRWTDVTALTVHLDVDDGDSPLVALEWTDQAGARTAIELSADGRTFFGRHQPAGQDELLYRGRLSRSTAMFPFAPAELPPAPEFFAESFTTCPVRELTGGTLDAPTVIDAARQRIRQSPKTVAKALRHLLLAHGFTARPQIARAIVELTPDQAPRAVGQLARFLNAVAEDPSTDQASYKETDPVDFEQLATVIALATLDEAYAAVAAVMFRDARPFLVAMFAPDYGGLGPTQRVQARTQVAGLAATTSDQTTAEYVIKALLRMHEFEHALTALRTFTERGLFFSLVARPLVDADPRVQPALVDSALRALVANPGFMLNLAPRKGGEAVVDVASDVIACGGQYRERVAHALGKLVEDTGLSAEIRWSAASRLGLVGVAEHAHAVSILVTQGVSDPEAPPPARPERTDAQLADALAAVTPVWRRIEHELARRFPTFGVELGPPASLAEVVACENALGFQLPLEFVASLLVHRRIQFADLVAGMPNQLDVAQLADYREWLGGEWTSDRAEPPGSPFHTDHGWRHGWVPLEAEQPQDGLALDLEPTPAGRYGQVLAMDHGMPQNVAAPGWLALLERFAADLEQDRYLRHADGYLDLKRLDPKREADG